MANVLINDNILKSIANAIRTKNNSTTKYKPAQMPGAILALNVTDGTSTGNIEDMVTNAQDIDFDSEWED